ESDLRAKRRLGTVEECQINNPNMLQGVIHERTIELEQDPGLPPGQPVFVSIEPRLEANNQGQLPPGEGLRQAFGAWAEDAEELDKYLEWTRQERKVGRPPVE